MIKDGFMLIVTCGMALAFPLAGGHAQVKPTTGPAVAKVELLVPADIKPTGQHGTVLLEGDVSPEGRMINLAVIRSSKAPLIDARALKLLTNARLNSELLVGKPTRVRVEVAIYNTKGLDFGANFPCSQAVLDADWYATAFAGAGNERTPLYELIAFGGGLMGDQRLAFAADRARYDRIWTRAVESCRATPDTPFLKVLIDLGKGVP